MVQHLMVVSYVTCNVVHYIFSVAFDEYELCALSFVRVFIYFFFLSANNAWHIFGSLSMRFTRCNLIWPMLIIRFSYSIFDLRATGNLKNEVLSLAQCPVQFKSTAFQFLFLVGRYYHPFILSINIYFICENFNEVIGLKKSKFVVLMYPWFVGHISFFLFLLPLRYSFSWGARHSYCLRAYINVNILYFFSVTCNITYFIFIRLLETFSFKNLENQHCQYFKKISLQNLF